MNRWRRLLDIYDYCNSKPRRWIDSGEIETKLELPARAVRRGLNYLEAAGVIELARGARGGGGQRTRARWIAKRHRKDC